MMSIISDLLQVQHTPFHNTRKRHFQFEEVTQVYLGNPAYTLLQTITLTSSGNSFQASGSWFQSPLLAASSKTQLMMFRLVRQVTT
ncbi:MAG: hypothetical protein CM15mP59_6370 [Flavobacteriaceae bacterium]|nr:MAG: hypothetical protein CM15mP59_6370 [Flavobacteriaceae bacterium]